jgi:hypothetical protein
VNDNEMQDAFRALAAEDAREASSFSRARVEAQRQSLRARRRRAWFTASGVAVAAAAALIFAVMPKQELLELDLSGTRVASATDFLLNTPGRSLMRTVPAIGVTTISRRPTPSLSRTDTSGSDK